MESTEEKNLNRVLNQLDCSLNSQVSLATLKYLLSRLEVMQERCTRLVEEMEMVEKNNLKEESVRITMHSEGNCLNHEPAVATAVVNVSLPEDTLDPPELKSDLSSSL